jgi:hypothetical protein
MRGRHHGADRGCADSARRGDGVALGKGAYESGEAVFRIRIVSTPIAQVAHSDRQIAVK